jgi:hypothetical protein
MPLGAGFSAAGFSPGGFGDLEEAPEPATDNLIDENGVQQTARAIDAATGEYILNASGRAQGMPRARQLVLLRIKTRFGSAAIPGLGVRDQGGDRDIVAERRLKADLTAAVDDLVQAGIIRVLSVDVAADSPVRERALLRWEDLTTGQQESFP